jgi:SAM-dependent methyltransferase
VSFRCGICESESGVVVFQAVPDYEYGISSGTTLARCTNCGVVQQNPLPGRDELGAFYPSDYHAYHYDASLFGDWLKTRYSRRIGRQIRDRIGRRGAILDLGCADGAFLAALERLGEWELHGLDINPEVIRRPRSERLLLRAGQLSADTYPPERFDAIVAIHLIEHVADPVELIGVCAKLLRPGGILIGELPNFDSWDRRLFGRYWGGLHLPRHLFFWDPDSLAALGRQGGFACIELHPMLQPAHWAISLQNVLVSRWPGLRRSLRQGRLPLYTVAVLASLPFNWLQNQMGSPSIMGFLFQKATA